MIFQSIQMESPASWIVQSDNSFRVAVSRRVKVMEVNDKRPKQISEYHHRQQFIYFRNLYHKCENGSYGTFWKTWVPVASPVCFNPLKNFFPKPLAAFEKYFEINAAWVTLRQQLSIVFSRTIIGLMVVDVSNHTDLLFSV